MKKRNIFTKFSLTAILLSALFAFSSVRASSNIVRTEAWSGTQTSTEGTYYSTVGSETGTALLNKLKTITGNPTPQTSYDWYRYEAADEAENESNKVLLIYSRQKVLKTAHVSGSTGWNREHTYPDSKISGAAKSDNHHIFADDNRTNSARGNMPFGVVAQTSTNRVKDGYGNLTDCYKDGTYFYPNEPARGEVARATMYVNMRYGYSVTGNFQSIALMLEWHLQNPVSNREIYRNNTVHTMQKNRNPFIDHPEYACRIWGNTNSATQAICGAAQQVDVTSVSVSPSSGSINLLDVNKTLQLSANVLPANATNKSVNWSTSNSSIATVDANGLVTGKAVGNVTITATSVSNPSVKGTASIAVSNTSIPVTGVTISDKSFTLVKDATKTLTATVSPANASNKNVTWSSSNTSVATVSSSGVVTGVSAGNATITVTTVDGGKTDTANVTVANAPPTQSETTTYTFSTEGWTATPANWQSMYPADGFETDQNYLRGMQVLGSNTAYGNSPYFDNVKKVIFGTAASGSGAGTYSAYLVTSSTSNLKDGTQIGTDVTVSKPGATIIERTFELTTPASGHVQAIIDATSNSLYLKYVTIEVATPINYQGEADLWANGFLESTSAGCSSQSQSTLSSIWPNLSNEYNALAAEVKAIIEGSTPNSAGSEVEQALARYVFIVNKYGFTAFINGNPASGVHDTMHNDKQLAEPLLILFSVATLSLIPFVYKRKKRTLN